MSALTNFEQDLVNIAKKVKADVEAVGDDAGKALGWISNEAPEIAGLASLAGPSGATIVTLGLKLIGLAGNALQDSGTAASASALNVSLDQTVIKDVEAIIAAVKSL
jgi:hypothetical protein